MQRTVATERVRATVLRATLDALAEDGVAGLRIERVAEAAGVAKTTIYRSWGTREALVADALSEAAARDIPTPDTGSLRGDLLELARRVARVITSGDGRRIFAAFAAGSPELGEVARSYWEARFRSHQAVVERAVARGELPAGVPANELVAALVGPLVFRSLLSHEPIPAAFVRRTVDRVLGGIAG